MTYIEFLKKYDNYDKYILYLLAQGFDVAQTAEKAEVARQTVYTAINRNKDLVKSYIEAIKPLLEEE
jgi:predicted DNA-binding protein YlxM (UPF0122 family)